MKAVFIETTEFTAWVTEYLPDEIFLPDIYGKDEKDNLSPLERRILAALADHLKREARATTRRGKKGRSKP